MSSVRFTSLAIAAFFAASPAAAVEFSFLAPGARGALWEAIATASLTRESTIANDADAQSIFASARADYARILAALYAKGYYSPEIYIKINGVEAASIAPMDVPDRLDTVTVRITIGPKFHFSQARIAPLAKPELIPEGFAQGRVAEAGLIKESARAAVEGWREIGHAKARISAQSLQADHARAELSADLRVESGPRAYFGELDARGAERLRHDRLLAIAGYPTGRQFSPERFEDVAARLRRTGIFSSVALTETETLRGDKLDATLQVAEAPLRRIGGGGEVATLDGLSLSGYWMHRNLLGGGEKLRFDAEIGGINGQSSGTDYEIGARFDRPATFSPDTTAYFETRLSLEDEPDYLSKQASVEGGVSHVLNRRAVGDLGLAYRWSRTKENGEETIFRHIALPMKFTYDSRKDKLNPAGGQFLVLGVTPFLGLGETGSGGQFTSDVRVYKSLDSQEKFVLAGRFSAGVVAGAELAQTPHEYLFYSGGGGSVRGQPYQSLGVQNGARRTGGTTFIGLAGELRADLRGNFGAVAFYDAGFVGAESFKDGAWHSGAGLGLRYETGIGPIRLDVAAPVEGTTGDGPQVYIGIGQAF